MVTTLRPRIWVPSVQRLLLKTPPLAIFPKLRRQFQFSQYHALANRTNSATTTTTSYCRNEKAIVLLQVHGRESKRRHYFFSSPNTMDPTPSDLNREYREWVSVWQKRDDGRRIYLLGTNHFDPISIKLTKQLVRNVQPNAVFVELDECRAKHIIRSVVDSTYIDTYEPTRVLPHAGSIITWLFPPRKPFSILWEWFRGGQQEMGPTMFYEQRFMFFKSALQSQTKHINKKEHSEFDFAIIEGHKIGAAVVLGDRNDRWRTIPFLSFIAQLFLGLLLGQQPLVLRKLFKAHKFDEFSLESKGDVRQLVSHVSVWSPSGYKRFISSRDDYMAVGLNSLVQFETIVAIMGKAHIFGVEERLQEFGWIQIDDERGDGAGDNEQPSSPGIDAN